jgi:hypothetical protein
MIFFLSLSGKTKKDSSRLKQLILNHQIIESKKNIINGEQKKKRNTNKGETYKLNHILDKTGVFFFTFHCLYCIFLYNAYLYNI